MYQYKQTVELQVSHWSGECQGIVNWSCLDLANNCMVKLEDWKMIICDLKVRVRN